MPGKKRRIQVIWPAAMSFSARTIRWIRKLRRRSWMNWASRPRRRTTGRRAWKNSGIRRFIFMTWFWWTSVCRSWMVMKQQVKFERWIVKMPRLFRSLRWRRTPFRMTYKNAFRQVWTDILPNRLILNFWRENYRKQSHIRRHDRY